MEGKADALIGQVRQRLAALVEQRPYRFINTSRAEAAAYLHHKGKFAGYAEAEIAAAEQRLSVQFPTVFRAYLHQMGRARGELFGGSEVTELDQFEQAREDAEQILTESEVDLALPARALVLLTHQGYTFVFLEGNGGFDAPVFQYVEGEEAWTEVAPGFAELLDGELSQMEANHRASLENGGHYVSIQNGYVSESYPALAIGERPVDGPDQFID